LHAGQHALHAAEDDVADQAVAAAAVGFPARAVVEADGALDHEILQPAVLDDGDANLTGACVDQDILLHAGAQAIATRNANTDSGRIEAARLFRAAASRRHSNKSRRDSERK